MTETHYLTDILILLAAAIVMVPIFQRLGLGSVLGYLAAGTLVGPWGLAIIDRIDEIRHIAEFGVVFLLFIIGIELRPARLWAMRRQVFGLGASQVMLTGLALAGLALLFDQSLKVAIIAGFGRVGRRVARILQAGNVPYLAIESDEDRVLDGRQNGFPVFYGDASQVDVLKAAGARRAGIIVCTLDKPVPAVRMVSILRQEYPDIAIHARGHDRRHCDELRAAGATVAISETLEASLHIGEGVLGRMGVPGEKVSDLIDTFRKEYYG